MRWLPIAVAVAAFALVGAGCGGDEESSADTDTVVATDTSATDETTTDETTTEETETETDISGIPSADCLQAVSAFGVLAQAAAGAGGDADESLQTFQAFADSAPDEVRDDLQVLASGYAEYIRTLSELGLEQGEVPNADQIAALEKASEKFNTSEFQAASQNWDAWIADNCPG